MKKVLMTNMSTRGQVVIPGEIRRFLGLTPGVPLAVYTDGHTLLLKPIELPNPEDFTELLVESQKAARKSQVKKKDLKNIIKKVRRESRS